MKVNSPSRGQTHSQEVKGEAVELFFLNGSPLQKKRALFGKTCQVFSITNFGILNKWN
jgi:hypothetical protein